jgi:hypothetical protein
MDTCVLWKIESGVKNWKIKNGVLQALQFQSLWSAANFQAGQAKLILFHMLEINHFL